jgi:hypothetical protein
VFADIAVRAVEEAAQRDRVERRGPAPGGDGHPAAAYKTVT